MEWHMTEENKPLSAQVETIVVPDGERERASRSDKGKARQKSYVLDLRIHSPASLGYLSIEGIDTAPALVRLAKVKGLDVIAVTDFYSGKFIDRITDAAKGSPLTVIPGVAIRCAIGACDDVVLSCLFPEGFTGAQVESFLRSLDVPVTTAGDKSYLVRKSFEEILKAIEEHGGVALPSRMDKTPHRLAAIPALVEKYGFRAFDLAYADSTRYFKSKWPKIKFQLFSFSNAHALAQVGSRIAKVKMTEPGFTGIKAMVARDALERGETAQG
jgi:predicted metal-dependent phosphoesterase TrpH